MNPPLGALGCPQDPVRTWDCIAGLARSHAVSKVALQCIMCATAKMACSDLLAQCRRHSTVGTGAQTQPACSNDPHTVICARHGKAQGERDTLGASPVCMPTQAHCSVLMLLTACTAVTVSASCHLQPCSNATNNMTGPLLLHHVVRFTDCSIMTRVKLSFQQMG